MGRCLPTISSLFECRVVEPMQIECILAEARELQVMRNLRLIRQLDSLQQRISKLECRTERLEVESRFDALTGLYNRRYLEDRLALELSVAVAQDQPLGLAFLDLDHFKAVNDTHGHLVGDQVLVTVARLLGHQLRHTDLVARYGGEEFVILLPGTRQVSAQGLLEGLLQRLREHPVEVSGNQSLRITTSIGLATYPDGGYFPRPENLVWAADQALYQAKRDGRNRLVIYKNEPGCSIAISGLQGQMEEHRAEGKT